MSSFLTRIIGDKKDRKAMEAHARVLPRDYRVVYGEMKFYMWSVTGRDVAAFCDARLSGPSYLDRWRATLNRDVAAKRTE